VVTIRDEENYESKPVQPVYGMKCENLDRLELHFQVAEFMRFNLKLVCKVRKWSHCMYWWVIFILRHLCRAISMGKEFNYCTQKDN